MSCDEAIKVLESQLTWQVHATNELLAAAKAALALMHRVDWVGPQWNESLDVRAALDVAIDRAEGK